MRGRGDGAATSGGMDEEDVGAASPRRGARMQWPGQRHPVSNGSETDGGKKMMTEGRIEWLMSAGLDDRTANGPTIGPVRRCLASPITKWISCHYGLTRIFSNMNKLFTIHRNFGGSFL